MPNTVVLYVLNCDHVMPGPVMISSDELPCLACAQARKKIVRVHDFEWRAHCYSCGMTRWAGTAKHIAEGTANRHFRNAHHSARVEYARNPLAVKAMKRLEKLGLLSKS